MLRRLRAQTTAEYAVLFAVVIGAAVAMQVYIKRGLAAKQKSGVDAFTHINASFTSKDTTANVAGGSFGALEQYEPYYLESFNRRYQENIEQEHMGVGQVIKEKVSDISATEAGGYQNQAGGVNRAARDDVWEGKVTGTK